MYVHSHQLRDCALSIPEPAFSFAPSSPKAHSYTTQSEYCDKHLLPKQLTPFTPKNFRLATISHNRKDSALCQSVRVIFVAGKKALLVAAFEHGIKRKQREGVQTHGRRGMLLVQP